MTAAKVTARRADVARLRAAGRDRAQIAAELGCSIGTVAGDIKALGVAAPRSARPGAAPIGRAPVLDPDATEKPCPGRFCKGLVVKARADFRHDASTRDQMSWACKVCMTADDEDNRRAKGAQPRRRGRKPRPAPTGRPPGTPAVYAPAITKADAAAWPPAIDISTACEALGVSYHALAQSPRSPVEFVTVAGRRKVRAASVIRLLPDAPAPGGNHERSRSVLAAVAIAGPDGITLDELAGQLRVQDPGKWLRRYVTRMVDRKELARIGRGRYVLPDQPQRSDLQKGHLARIRPRLSPKFHRRGWAATGRHARPRVDVGGLTCGYAGGDGPGRGGPGRGG